MTIHTSHDYCRAGRCRPSAGPVAGRVAGLLCAIVVAGSSSPIDADSQPPAATELSWRKTGDSVALMREDKTVWQFHYGDELDVPFFHPLATTTGQVLTWNAPPDHVWHHGFWFCWKYINDVNYWELNRETGKPDGQTRWRDVGVETKPDGSARILMSLSYRPAGKDGAGEGIVLKEQRRIDISAPQPSGTYRIDWTSMFERQRATVVLDRTPPREQAWGGYAGLSVRFAENLVDRQAFNTSGPIQFGSGHRHRGRAPAMEYNGMVDGQAVGLAFLDHPDNPRHPTPWYLIRSPVMGYMNAAVLHDEPMTLDSTSGFTLRYRLIIHTGRWDAERLEAAVEEFRNASGRRQNRPDRQQPSPVEN